MPEVRNGAAARMDLRHPVICVVGPTASGKSAVAQELACRMDGCVVSADSMQIYRGMDIGTGKVLPDEMRVEHFGIDICEPGQAFSASLFQEYARACFARIDAAGRRIVLAGGTGFYVRAAIDDYRFPAGEQVGNPIRDRYQAFADVHGSQALWDELDRIDPESAALIHPNNTKRVIRAFEILEGEGSTYAAQHAGFASMGQYVPAVFFGLKVDPELLKARIDRRVDAMIAQGLVAEVEGLLEAGFADALTAAEAIGYKEIVAALRGQCTLDEAVAAIKQATRRYAKRQRSWWRGDGRIRWIDADDGDAARIAAEIAGCCGKL